MCLTPRQAVNELVGWVCCLLLRKKENILRWLSQCPLPPPTAASPRVSSLAKWRVMVDALCRSSLCIPASLSHPWLYKAASSEPQQAVHILAQWQCKSLRLHSVSGDRSTYMLSGCYVSDPYRWMNMQDLVEIKNKVIHFHVRQLSFN